MATVTHMDRYRPKGPVTNLGLLLFAGLATFMGLFTFSLVAHHAAALERPYAAQRLHHLDRTPWAMSASPFAGGLTR